MLKYLLMALSSLTLLSNAYAQNPPLKILDEGVGGGIPAYVLDCVGAGISCSHSGITGTITVGGGHGDGANCSAGSYPLGVDADGAVQVCTDASTEIDSIVATHTAIDSAHHDPVTLGKTGGTYLALVGQVLTGETLVESDISDLTHTTDTGPSPDCSGTTTYQDGEGGCDDISSVYEPVKTSSNTELLWDNNGTIDGIEECTLTDGFFILCTPLEFRVYNDRVGSRAAYFQSIISDDLPSSPDQVAIDTVATYTGTSGLSQAEPFTGLENVTTWQSNNNNTSYVAGMELTAKVASSSADMNILAGLQASVAHEGTGTVTEANGLKFNAVGNGSGTTTELNGINMLGALIAGGHTVGTYNQIKLQDPLLVTGTLTNQRGLYVEPMGSEASAQNFEVFMGVDGQIFFRDGDINIGSLSDGVLDFDSDTTFKFNTGQVAFENYSFPLADGTVNQILETDGAGTLSWVAAGGGASSLDGAYNGGNTIDVDGDPVTMTVSDTDNNTALDLVQNDVTNNNDIFTTTTPGTGANTSHTNTNAGTAGVNEETFHDSASALAADVMYLNTFYGNDSLGNKTPYGAIEVAPGLVDDGLEIGNVTFKAYDYTAGALVTYLGAYGGSAVNLDGVYMGDVAGGQYARISGSADALGNSAGSIIFTGSSVHLTTKTGAYAFKHWNTDAGLAFIGGGDSGFQWYTTDGSMLFNLGVGAPDIRVYTSGRGLDQGTAGNTLDIGGTNAGPIDYGNATNTTIQTFITDGTGDGEMVLPDDSIGIDEVDSAGDYVWTGTHSGGHNLFSAVTTGDINVTAGFIDITLTEQIEDSYYTHVASAAGIQFNHDGLYKMHWDFSVDQTGGNNRSTFQCKLQEDVGAGYVDIANSSCYIYSRLTLEGEGSCSVQMLRDFDNTEDVKAVCDVISGVASPGLVTTIGTRMNIEFLRDS